MVFMDAGAAHRVQHDINQICEAIARLLAKLDLESSTQPEAIPRIDIEVEEGPKQGLLAGDPMPALGGQVSPPVLEGQPERLRIEGRDFAALPYRDSDPLGLSPRVPLNLDPTETSVRIELGDAVIERPLPLLLPALEELRPEQIITLRQLLEYPIESERSLPVKMAHTAARIEVDNIEHFAIADGQVQVNTLYPEIVKIQADAIAVSQLNATPDQVEDLSRYMLQHYAPEQPDGGRGLYVMDEQQGVDVTLSPERDIILDFDPFNLDSTIQAPENLTDDLNLVYQLLNEELQRQRNLPPQAPMPKKLLAFFSDTPSLEMQQRPLSEVEATNGQQMGNVETLHHEVLSESPVLLVSVDDLGRPTPASSVVGHVEVTEDLVETQAIHQAIAFRVQQEQRLELVTLNQLQSFFEQTGVRELESPETGMAIQRQGAGLVASTSNGHLLILDGDRVQTNFTPTEIQQLAEMAQEATLALAADEISSDTIQPFNREMERG
ncbi:MAG: hypothetical protein KME12_17955 [Trichocoleus desertorum ATA4-8-CV12]|jgi:hypothetical protein|nr:hypothetical protein [Trichocoleus desertorum ATA4-8-CV12]